MKQQFNLLYAMSNGRITHISEVINAPDLSCICPACCEELIVAKDKSGAFCFAHESGNPCEYGFQYSVCCAVADMLSQGKALTLPPVTISFPSVRKPILLAGETKVIFDSVNLDYSIDKNRPVIIARKNNKSLMLTFFAEEIFYFEDIRKMTEYGISILALNLKGLDRPMSKSQIEKYILERTQIKMWLLNLFENTCFDNIAAEAKRYNIIRRGDYLYTTYCPLSRRIVNNIPCANFIEDCQSRCRYYIYHSSGSGGNRLIRSDFTGDYILCAGNNEKNPPK